MPKNKMSKRLLSGVMAAAMSASALMAGMTSLTAFAGEELGHGDFNDGAGLPWHICESATGTMKFEIADGCYNILITNPGGLSNNGEGRWDCQFRHRGLTIEEGHTYRLTYSVWTDDSNAKIYAKLGDMTNDDKEMWHGNGTVLNLSYSDVEGKDMAGIEAALKAASPSGQTVDYGQGWDAWKNSTLPVNTWTTYAYEFQPQGSAEGVGEWTFHLGGTSNYNDFICVHENQVIKFDNMALIDMKDDKSDYVHEDAYKISGIEVNQVGYFTKLSKKATLVLGDSADSTPKAFQVKDSSGATVYEGTTTGGSTLCDASGTYNQVIDFSDFQTEGTGYTITCDGKTSLPFDIGNAIYGNLTTEAMNYFYQNRSGVDIEAQYIVSENPNGEKATANDLAREAGHTKDVAYIQSKWVYIIPDDASVEKNNGSLDVTGGWYDAGDHGKYVVNGGVSIWTLLSLFDRDVNKGDTSKWDDGSGTVVIPENGNKIPDILDEVQVEIDFFKKMQDPADGMVYHKIHDYKWTALAVSPADATARTEAGELTRIIKPKTYAATLNFAAALAQYSRLIQPYNPSEASDCLALAEKAYAAAKSCYAPYVTVPDQNADHVSLYAPLTQNKGGGPYGDTCVTDEFYWAACELYITSGKADYKTDMLSYNDESGSCYAVPTALYGGENNGSCSAFTWGTVGSLGTLSLCINGQAMVDKGLLTADELTTIQNSVKSAADYFLKLEDESDFGVPYVGHDYETEVWTLANGMTKKTLENGYEWGSNSMIVNNAMVMGLAYDIDHEAQYISGVSTAMDYIMGRNVLEQSYVTGYGEHELEYPHHRWWSYQLDNSFPSAPKGVMSGGPNSEMQDPMIQGKGYKAGEIAPMVCYIDNLEAWSVNECTINWNSPLVWISSFLEDEAPYVDGETTSKTTTTTTSTTGGDSSDTTTTTTVTTGTGDSSDTTTKGTGDVDGLIGDTNLDGVVSLIDVVYLNKYLAGAIDFNAQQMHNAQCVADAEGKVNSGDVTALLKFVVEIIKALPVTAE
ncbi:MAG: glycoside hydrolase family 9 protein [Ruminococcus sp.]